MKACTHLTASVYHSCPSLKSCPSLISNHQMWKCYFLQLKPSHFPGLYGHIFTIFTNFVATLKQHVVAKAVSRIYASMREPDESWLRIGLIYTNSLLSGVWYDTHTLTIDLLRRYKKPWVFLIYFSFFLSVVIRWKFSVFFMTA